MTVAAAARPIAILDDDPTGPQAAQDVIVALRPDAATIRDALDRRATAVHVLTNSRALEPSAAQAVTHTAARAVAAAAPGMDILLRGDSTLRGHLLEEYLAVREVVHPACWPTVLLAPALPAAGRVTLHGTHYLHDRLGRRIPLHETEFARDASFAYSDADLLRWAEHRSGGLFPAADGHSIDLATVRAAGGTEAIVEAITQASRSRRPAAVAPDAASDEDLLVVAEAWRRARALNVPVIVRSGPAFAALVAGTAAEHLAPLPHMDRPLFVCGSHVEMATRQLRRLEEVISDAAVVVSATALVDDDPRERIAEIARAGALLDARLADDRLAILATPRTRPPAVRSLAAGRRVAQGVCDVVRSLENRPDGLIVKGGITSATVATDGLDAGLATVVGPVENGVALWNLHAPQGALPYLVVPGNVGDDDTLARLALRVMQRPRLEAGT